MCTFQSCESSRAAFPLINTLPLNLLEKSALRFEKAKDGSNVSLCKFACSWFVFWAEGMSKGLPPAVYKRMSPLQLCFNE